MTRAAVLLLLVLASCATAPIPGSFSRGICLTPCGAKVYNVTDEVTCDQLAKYEDATDQVLHTCPALQGFTVQVLETYGTNAWVDAWGRTVAGLTFCETKTIQIGTDTWTESAYAHESIHAQDCPHDDLEHEAPIWKTGFEAKVNQIYLAPNK